MCICRIPSSDILILLGSLEGMTCEETAYDGLCLWFRSIWVSLIHLLSFYLSFRRRHLYCMWSVSETMGQGLGVGFQWGTGKSVTPERSQPLPSRKLVYWVRGLGTDRNPIENVPWREIGSYLGTQLIWNSSNFILNTFWHENFALVHVVCLVLILPPGTN